MDESMRPRQKGFSLIELMVVIAIVALLSAVAIPVYKTYSIRSKILSAVAVVNKIKLMEIEYYNKFGSYTNANGIGLTNASPPCTVLNPTSYSPYLSGLYVNNACSNTSAEITLEFNNTALGYSGSELLLVSYLVRPASDGSRHLMQCIYRTDGTSITAAIASRYLPNECQTPLGNPSLVACPALP